MATFHHFGVPTTPIDESLRIAFVKDGDALLELMQEI